MYSAEFRKQTEQKREQTVRKRADQTDYLPGDAESDGKGSDLSFEDMKVHYRSAPFGPEKTAEPEEPHLWPEAILPEAEEVSKEEILPLSARQPEEETQEDTGGVVQRMPGILSAIGAHPVAAGLGGMALAAAGYLIHRGIRYLRSPYRKSKRLVRDVERGRIPLDTTRRKGNYGEARMDVHFEEQGYDRISGDRVTGIDDKTHHGLDGVYHKKGANPPYVVGEAKFNTAKLGKTRDGQQMSHTWIRGSGRLVDAVGKKKADEILLAGYDRQVVRVMPDHSVTCTSLQ